MTMKLLVILFGSLFSLPAWAGVFKCTDESGRIVYRSGPCQGSQSNFKIDLKTGAKTDMNQERENQVLREQQDHEKADAEEQEAKAQAERKERLKQEARDESAKNQFLVKNNRLKYSAFAIPPYDPDKLPPLVENFSSRLPEIEKMRRVAGEKALATNQCGRVESVELNVRSAPGKLVILADCSSGQKFYFSEQELKSP